MPDIFTKELVPSYKRADMHMIDPRQIKLDPMFQGRVDPVDVGGFYMDFLNPKIGQLLPVTIRKKDDGLPYIVDGAGRWEAAIRVTEEGKGPFDGVFKLACKYFVANSDFDAFKATVKANIRNEPTVRDDAHNVSILHHNFHMSAEDIAIGVYNRQDAAGKPDTKWVEDMLILADLTPEGVIAMKEGRLAVPQALKLARLAKNAQKSLLKEQGDAKKITTAVIKRAAGPAPQSDTGTVPAATPAKRKFQKQDFCDILSRYLASDLPKHVLEMTVENAVRTVLGEISDEIECGQ